MNAVGRPVLTPSNEDRIWSDVREGDPRAFEVLFDRYADFIYNVAFRRTGSWDVAEEIVSSVFLEAWRQRDRVETRDGTIRPWLIGVTLNQIRRHWRQTERSRKASLRLVADQDHQHDHAEEVARCLDAEKQMARILTELDELPIDQREVLELWVWEELSYEDIAVSLGIPIGTVRSRLHRARERLRRDRGTVPAHRASMGDNTANTDIGSVVSEGGATT